MATAWRPHPVDVLILVSTLLAAWRLRHFARRRFTLQQTRWLDRGTKLLVGALLGNSIFSLLPPVWFPAGLVAWCLAISLLGGLLFCGLAVVTLVLDVMPVPEAQPDPGRRRLVQAARNAVVAAPALVAGYGTFIERNIVRQHEADLLIPRLAPDLDGLRIAQLTDMHYGTFFGRSAMERAVAMANEYRPHLTVLTGDFISRPHDPLDECLRILGTLRAEAGLYGCLGNHERFAEVEDECTRLAARVGIRLLRHESQPLRFGQATLQLSGVDYQKRGTVYLPGAGQLRRDGALNLLLSHNPDVLPVAASKGFDVMLAGHTHGGQVTVEIVSQYANVARFITPFVRGLYREGNSLGYVSTGLGTVGLPVRINTPPEVTLLRLRRA